MNPLKLAVSAFAVGAASMYFADPDRGRRRRALVRDKTVGTWNDLTSVLDQARRDVSNRAEGALSTVRSVFEDHRAIDPVLVQRVRSRIGHLVSHPHAIDVQAQDGRIVLSGPILGAEVDSALRAAWTVPGVKEVINRLESHENSEGVAGLQGGAPRQLRSEIMQQNWTPALRVGAGGAGLGLILCSFRYHGIPRMTTRLAGMTLLARAVANKELRDIGGMKDNPALVHFNKTVHIHAPVTEVFAFWSDYKRFPSFMSHLKEVHDLGNGRSRWVAEGPGGISVTWEAEMTQSIPNRLLAWRSIPGSRVQTEGSVRFDENGNGGTRVTIRMSYAPPAGVLGHYVASLFGSDPKHELDEDMVRLKSLIELGRTRAHGHKVTREALQARATV